MQFPPELRGSQQFPATGLHPLSQHEQQQQQQLTGPWVGSGQAVNGVLGPFAPPTAPLAQHGAGFLATPVQPAPAPQPVVGSPPCPLPVAPPSSTPWVQTVPQAMPWGTYPATTASGRGPLQLMRFSAGDQPTWAVNERRFRKRYLPAFGPEPPRKQAITEEKIAAQLSDLSLDGVLSPSTTGGQESEEKRLHVLCPELVETTPAPQPLLPQPVIDDLRKRATMAVVLWQPLGPPTADKASGEDGTGDKKEPSHRETKGEEEGEEEAASMEL